MSEKIRKHIEQLRSALKLEWEADLKEYKSRIEKLPLNERIDQGFTWHPLVVQKSGYTFGEHAFVIVEGNPTNKPHQFRSGSSVEFYSLQAGAQPARLFGVVNYVSRNQMKIILNSKDLPDWLQLGNIGVDLLFDERSYLEMERALKALEETKQGRLADLGKVLMGIEDPRYLPREHQISIPSLNNSQNRAVNRVLESQDVAIIHGPPGTGKTTTLVQAVRVLAEEEATILVAAPSNTAVDLLTERLDAAGLNVVRIGHISRVDESIIRHTLEALMSAHPESKNLKKVKIEANETRKKARRYRRKFGHEERGERRELYRLAGELEAWARQLENRLIDQILSGAQVITCTLVGAAHPILKDRKFRTVVIDEAAQALEPATWIPIMKGSRLVLAGDPYQLPPTVKSIEAERKGLSVTIIERCLKQWEEVSLLNIQYRMHQDIMGFSNSRFYNNDLSADVSVATHSLAGWQGPALVFLDTAGCGFDEKTGENGKSRSNPEELQILWEHLYQLLDQATESDINIALISPYRQQVNLMEAQLREEANLEEWSITVKTIDGFQGQERDVVYISLVRSNAKGEIGFLSDIRRMNVAMTRARKLLVVVGDSATIGAHPFYEALLEYVEQAGSYQTAWEYMR